MALSTMRLVYQRDIIRGVRKRWMDQYQGWDRSHRFGTGKTIGEVDAALASLDLEKCSVADVYAAIGTDDGWIENECDECGKDFPVLVRLGADPDYEERWQDLCECCLNAAAALTQQAKIT